MINIIFTGKIKTMYVKAFTIDLKSLYYILLTIYERNACNLLCIAFISSSSSSSTALDISFVEEAPSGTIDGGRGPSPNLPAVISHRTYNVEKYIIFLRKENKLLVIIANLIDLALSFFFHFFGIFQ